MVPEPSPVKTQLCPSLDELNAQKRWFQDPARPPERGPFVIVVDDFYPDPLAVRALALEAEFIQYSPPLAEQVGEETAAKFRGQRPSWFTSALKVHHGVAVKKPFRGFRYDPPGIVERLSHLVGEEIVRETWADGGDWWNCAFQLINAEWDDSRGTVHHHYKEGDVAPHGWSGVVYLSPDAPPISGTSVWRDKSSGLCIAPLGATFRPDFENFEIAYLVENRFNRLVLFRENVLHRAGPGFGSGKDARLTQSFFFRTKPHRNAD